MIALIGTGVATSYGSFLETSSNTVSYEGTGINILENDNGNWVPLGNSVALGCPQPVISGGTATYTAQTVTMNSYKLDVDCTSTSTVNCWLIFNDPLTWAIVDSATISINGSVAKNLIISSSTVGGETARMQSTDPVSFSLADGQYSFVLTITYKNISIDLSDGDSSKASALADLAGTKLVFELQS